jgi:hypothetical protein
LHHHAQHQRFRGVAGKGHITNGFSGRKKTLWGDDRCESGSKFAVISNEKKIQQ